MTKPPTFQRDDSAKPIRLTITVSPEVHAAFSRMAAVAGLPVGRCMGEWLHDTLEGVEFITSQLEKAREAPRQVVKEMRQWALGAVDEADELLAGLRAGKLRQGPAQPPGGAPAGAGRHRAAEAAPPTSPRLVIRGGKSTKTSTKAPTTRGGKSS